MSVSSRFIFSSLDVTRLQSRVEALLDEFALADVFRHLAENSSRDAPYHNHYHTLCMIQHCGEGAQFHAFRRSRTRSLLVAAAFHDFDHSEGYASDDTNIARAIEALKDRASGLNLSSRELADACAFVSVTQYPYLRDPSTTGEAIIRDADLMQPYETHSQTLVQQYLGLKTEVERSGRPKLGNADFAEALGEWYTKNAVWYSLWATDRAARLDFAAQRTRLVNLIAQQVDTRVRL